jgi:hypothetical protein
MVFIYCVYLSFEIIFRYTYHICRFSVLRVVDYDEKVMKIDRNLVFTDCDFV